MLTLELEFCAIVVLRRRNAKNMKSVVDHIFWLDWFCATDLQTEMLVNPVFIFFFYKAR